MFSLLFIKVFHLIASISGFFICFTDIFSSVHQHYNGLIAVYLKLVLIVGRKSLHPFLFNHFDYSCIFPFIFEF